MRRLLLKLGIASLVAFLTLPARAKDQWVAVSSTHFTVLTSQKPEVARAWALELERFRMVLQAVVSVPEKRLRPVTLILFPSDRAMRPYKPLENGKPQDVAGLFVNFCDSHAIGLSLDGDMEEIRRTIFHEVVHWYSNAGDIPMPMWLEEGVAEVYSTFTVTRDGTCSFGRPVQSHLELLARNSRWRMEDLVTTGRDSLKYNEGDRASQFYAEAWLVSHYLLFGHDTPGRESVARYLEAQSRATSLEATFKQAFGDDYAGFKARLQKYLNGGKYMIQSFRLDSSLIEKRLNSRAASEAEVELALGTFLVGSRQQGTPQAMLHLQRAAALAPENPVVWQVLGEVAELDHNLDEAERCFAKAVGAGSDSYYVHYSLGTQRIRGVDSNQGFIDTAAVQESARDFRRTIELNPRFVPAFEGLAGVIFAMEKYDPADRRLLEQGERLAPDSRVIDVGLAACDLREEQRARGRHRLELILQMSPLAPDVRRLAESLLQGDEWNELMQKLDGLFRAEQYPEAVKLIDEARERFKDLRYRDTLLTNRRRAVDSGNLRQAVALANDGQVDAATKLLQEMIDTDAELWAKREAQRLLGELSKIPPRRRKQE